MVFDADVCANLAYPGDLDFVFRLRISSKASRASPEVKDFVHQALSTARDFELPLYD